MPNLVFFYFRGSAEDHTATIYIAGIHLECVNFMSDGMDRRRTESMSFQYR